MLKNTNELIKFKLLVRRLSKFGETERSVIGLLELLWKHTAMQSPRGDIGRLSNDEIAMAVQFNGPSGELIDALIETKWLDKCPHYRLIVHDWKDNCPTWVRSKVSRSGKDFVSPDSSADSSPHSSSDSSADSSPHSSSDSSADSSPHSSGQYPSYPYPSSPYLASSKLASTPTLGELPWTMADGSIRTLTPDQIRDMHVAFSNVDVDHAVRQAWLHFRHGDPSKRPVDLWKSLAGWLNAARHDPKQRMNLRVVRDPVDEPKPQVDRIKAALDEIIEREEREKAELERRFQR